MLTPIRLPDAQRRKLRRGKVHDSFNFIWSTRKPLWMRNGKQLAESAFRDDGHWDGMVSHVQLKTGWSIKHYRSWHQPQASR